jgi:death on curing protein
VNEPRFLTLAEVCLYHDQSLAAFGGLNGVREIALLKSAVAQPQNDFAYATADLFGIAAAYAFHIAQNQPFLDGNKRTAVMSALAFLKLNGIDRIVDWCAIYDAMIAIAEKRMTKNELARLLRELFGNRAD